MPNSKRLVKLNIVIYLLILLFSGLLVFWLAGRSGFVLLTTPTIEFQNTGDNNSNVLEIKPASLPGHSEDELPPGEDQENDLFNLPTARNVILFIGDGMGEEHQKAARWFSSGIDGKLTMDELDAKGSIRTYSANSTITDSAAAATALASGVKTNNGVIGLDMNLNSVPTLLELAKLAGKSTGLVTTTMVSHATPAAFASHIESRQQMNDIAEQILSSEVDLILGGGEDEFYPEGISGCFPESGERTDGRNLIQEAVELGYVHLCDPASLQDYVPSPGTGLIGLFADEGMVEPYTPTLAEMTKKAIEVLSQNSEGFFLMVEGGQIDWSAHSNDAIGVISRTISFDNAIKAALDFPGLGPETLIIITADHETGGMITGLTSLGKLDEEGPFSMPDGTEFFVNWTSTKHTAANVSATASGPLSHWLNGTHDNTYIFDLISSALFGIDDYNSVFLPPDVDGDGLIDHASVCPWDGNWYISDNTNGAPIQINPFIVDDLPDPEGR